MSSLAAKRILEDYAVLKSENAFYINNPHTDASNGISIDGKSRDGFISAYTRTADGTLTIVRFKKKPLRI